MHNKVWKNNVKSISSFLHLWWVAMDTCTRFGSSCWRPQKLKNTTIVVLDRCISHFEKTGSLDTGADLGGGCRGCAPPSPFDTKPSSSYSLLKFVYLTSQLRYSLVVHPLLRKILDPPLGYYNWRVFFGLAIMVYEPLYHVTDMVWA